MTQEIFAERHAWFIKKHRPDALRAALEFETELHVLVQSAMAVAQEPFVKELYAFRNAALDLLSVDK